VHNKDITSSRTARLSGEATIPALEIKPPNYTISTIYTVSLKTGPL